MNNKSCPQCSCPMISSLCENPGCPQDKTGKQLEMILAAIEERKKQQEYHERSRIDYSKSFRKGIS